MNDMRLYVLQRLSAALMVPLIAVHLIVIYTATAKGLTAADILARTRGSMMWGGTYALFVVLAAVHGAIGVRVVMGEWTRIQPASRDLLSWTVGLVLLGLGLRAVAAVVLP